VAVKAENLFKSFCRIPYTFFSTFIGCCSLLMKTNDESKSIKGCDFQNKSAVSIRMLQRCLIFRSIWKGGVPGPNSPTQRRSTSMKSILDLYPKFLLRWINRERPIDSTKRQWNGECQELAASYYYVCLGLTAMSTLPVLMLQVMEYCTVSKVIVWCDILTQRAADTLFPKTWYVSALGQVALFIGWCELIQYLTMPLYVRVLAPLWRRKRWTKIASAHAGKIPSPTGGGAKQKVRKDSWKQ